jgi:hypothetical protein
MENEQELTEAQTKLNRENFKKRLKEEGRLENPFAPKVPQKNTNFNGF